ALPDVAVGKAGGAIDESAIRCPAEAAAQRGKPGIRGGAGKARARAGSAAADIGSVDISLDAEHKLSGLPVPAGRAAAQSARDIEVAGGGRRGERIVPGAAPGAAAVDAEVEPGPVVQH